MTSSHTAGRAGGESVSKTTGKLGLLCRKVVSEASASETNFSPVAT
jgi:hypothetical protein